MPRYNIETLVEIVNPELMALEELLSPVLEDFSSCREAFHAAGYAAEMQYLDFEDRLYYEIDSKCRNQIDAENVLKLLLPDLLELYPDRGRQSWARITPRDGYINVLGGAVKSSSVKLAAHDAAAATIWSNFALESEKADCRAAQGKTRADAIGALLLESLIAASFNAAPVMKRSFNAWHPNPSKVDAMFKVFENDALYIFISGESQKPTKIDVFPWGLREPSVLGHAFDQIEICLWAIPKRSIKVTAAPPWVFDFESVAFKVRRVLCYPHSYSRFYSGRGLQRIIHARLAEAGIAMRLGK